MTETGVPRRASFPWKDGRPPHVPCGPGEVAATALLPGDPERVGIAAGLFESVRDFGRRREYRAVTGTCFGADLTICSTGIGGPSTEIAMVELANLGVRRMIRIGGMGCLADDLEPGGFLIVAEACGDTGAAREYGGGGLARADAGIVAALAQAAQELALSYKVGRVMTTDSYYRGQGRAVRLDGSGGPADEGAFLADLRARGIDGMDMETETVLTIGAYVGVTAGAVLAVHGHRMTDAWLEDYEPVQRDLIRLAARATALLDCAGR